MKKNIYLLYAIGLLQGMVFYGPVATLYRQVRGVSVFEITLIESLSLGLCILLEIPWGVAAEKIGYRRTMVFCCSLYFISKIVFWQAEGFAGFLSERILLSVVLSGMSGVDSSILYLSCPQQESQKAFGIYNSMGMTGMLIAAVVFSLAIQEDYKLAGLLTVVSYGLAAVLAFGLTEVRAPEGRHPEKRVGILRDALPRGRFVLFLLAVALFSETHQTITVFLNQLQYQRCGMDDGEIGWVYILATVLGLGGGFSFRVTRKMGDKRACLLVCGMAIGACLMLAFTRSAWISVGGILTLRLANTLFQPFQAEIQNRQVQTKNRATVLSVNALFVDCIAIGTNLSFGALSQIGLPLAFGFGSALSVLALVFLLCWGRRAPNVV